MTTITPYLFFDGNCREAMEFYAKVLGCEVRLMTFADAQGDACPPAHKDKIMHGALMRGTSLLLMASDSPDEKPAHGTNTQLSLNCDSVAEIDAWFKGLSENGEVSLPLEDAFWGDRFGMLTDRFGFRWMLNCPLKKK